VSEFTALRAVSFTLRALLEEHITNSGVSGDVNPRKSGGGGEVAGNAWT